MKTVIMEYLIFLAVGALGCDIFEKDKRDKETFQKLNWHRDVVPYFPDTVDYLEDAEYLGTPVVISDFYVGRRIGITFKNKTGTHTIEVLVPWRTNFEIFNECGSINRYGQLDSPSHYWLLLGRKP